MHTGLAVITGTEDRQDAYVALTRGTEVNLAYVFSVSPKRADPAPGPRPAPELARFDKIYTERAGVPAPAAPPAPAGPVLGVLAAVPDHDGQQRSELWEKVRAVWARAWSANYAPLEFLQDTGLSRFSTVKP